MDLALNTHLRHSTIFSCELDAASRFAVHTQPRRYSSNGKHDILLGQNRTPDLGALRLGNINVIRIAADRFGHFFELGKSVGESLSPVVGNERNRLLFLDGMGSAIARAFSCNFFSFIWHFDFALNWRLVFPIYGSRNSI